MTHSAIAARKPARPPRAASGSIPPLNQTEQATRRLIHPRCSDGGVRVQPSELNRGTPGEVLVPRTSCRPGEVKGVLAQAIRAFLLALRRGQNPDTVSGGELGEEGRIGRDGLGQSQVAGRLARSRDELVESAW